MKSVYLQCEICGAQLGPENVIERLAMAKCDHCGAVFVPERLPGQQAAEPHVVERVNIRMPRGISVKSFGDRLVIRRRWFGCQAILVIFCAVLWNCAMPYAVMFYPGGWRNVLLIFMAIGIVFSYGALAMIFNSTTIRIARGKITVRLGPLPWWANLTLRLTDIKQLYCREHHGRDSCSYTVDILTHSMGRKKLLSGLDDPDQALFIEQEIENHLGIEDRHVGGEMPH